MARRNRSFLIEGYRELFRAVVGRQKIETLFYCPALFLGTNEQALIEKIAANGAQLYETSESLFRTLSYRDRPDGLVAIGCQQRKGLEEMKVGPCPIFLIAEAIEKPGNLGTILRSADGVGADGVIVCDRCTDIFNPNVVRASVGTLFTLPVREATTDETIAFLRHHKIKIVAATPEATCSYTEADLAGGVAIVVGSEQLGLTKRWKEEADLQVSIPMLGVADSLNVSTATTLLLYEALRQRHA